MATPQIVNPNAALSDTSVVNKNGGLDEPHKASAAVTARTVVSIGTDSQVAMAATNGTASLQIGIALKAIASGDTGPVRYHGVVDQVPATGAIAAGDLLKRSVTTTGSVSATATPVAGEVVGFAVAASASNLVTVFVLPSKGLS